MVDLTRRGFLKLIRHASAGSETGITRIAGSRGGAGNLLAITDHA